MSKTSYQYQPLTGPLPGASFERQTARFLNEVGGRADDAADTAQQAEIRAGQAVDTASSALGMASAAHGKATEAQASAAGAEKAAARAREAAEAAQNAADQGVGDASAARNAADAAATAARAAQEAAERGISEPAEARTAAQAAHAAADDAQATAFVAQSAAERGIGDAAAASEAASAAQTTADRGLAAAQAAQETADGKVSQALDDAVGVLPEANGGTGRTDGKAAALADARTIVLTGDVTGSAAFDGSADASITATVGNDSHTHSNVTITSLDAGKITSGVIDIARLPQGALERLIVVADDAARFALTAADAQIGDTVKVISTGLMYYVTDDSELSSEAGYSVYTAGAATTAASCTGNAATAAKLQTARTIALSGGATGTATAFDGSADVAVSVTALDMSAAATGVLPVERGGTGQSSVQALRSSMGLGNTLGALPVADGGTGATDAAAARAALGIGAASAGSAGIVRLNDTVTSTAADQAATANAARLAHDKGVDAGNAAQAAQNAANWAQTHMWPVTHVGSWFLDASWNNEQGNFTMQARDVSNAANTLPVRVARADYADNGGGGGLLSQLSLGTLLPWRSTALAAGLVWANGDAIYLNDWPEFRTMYQAGGLNGMVLPEGTTAAVRAANRGKWTVASGGTALLAPDMRGQFLRGQCPGYGNAGVWQTDAIRNITASWSRAENSSAWLGSASGAGTATGYIGDGAGGSLSSRNYGVQGFNASRVVPTGAENVPPHVWTPVAIYMGNHA